MEKDRNSLQSAGFLSSDLARFVADNRKHNATWFVLAEDINRTGQAVVTGMKISAGIDIQHLFALLFLIRSLSNHQGALLLAERGMAVEANTLVRCCFENAFCVGALRTDGEKFLHEMERSERYNLRSKGKWILEEPARLDFSGPNAVQHLQERVERMDKEWGQLSQLQWKHLAERGGLGDGYLFYKVLSGDYAHPSMSSLDRYVKRGPGPGISIADIKFGPDRESIANTLNLACHALLMVGLGVTEILGDTARQQEFSGHSRAYAGLNGIAAS